MHSEKGFTLLEVILSLALVGVMAAVAGTAIVTGAQGYVFARENAAIAQKAQLVTARMSRELKELTEVDFTNSNGTCIRYRVGAVSSYYRAIGLNSGNLELKVASGTDCSCPSSGDSGNTLADRIGAFGLQYEQQNGMPATNFAELDSIRVNYTLNRADGNPGNAFALTVNPRNNDEVNGP